MENGHWYTDKNGNHYFVKEGETPQEGWEASKRRKMINSGKYQTSEDGRNYKDVSKEEYEAYEADENEFDEDIKNDNDTINGIRRDLKNASTEDEMYLATNAIDKAVEDGLITEETADKLYKEADKYIDDMNNMPENEKAGEYQTAIKTPERQEYKNWYSRKDFKRNLDDVVSDLAYNNLSNEDIEEANNDIKHLLNKTVRAFEKDIKNDKLDKQKTIENYNGYFQDFDSILNDITNTSVRESIKTLGEEYKFKFRKIRDENQNKPQQGTSEERTQMSKIAKEVSSYIESYIGSEDNDNEMKEKALSKVKSILKYLETH